MIVKGVVGRMLVLMLLAILFTACTSDLGEEEGADEQAESLAKKELKWAVWDMDFISYYSDLVQAYEATNPNVSIELVDLGSQDYMGVLTMYLTERKSDIDLITIKDMPGYTNLVRREYLEPIDTQGIDLAQYKGITEQLAMKDGLYALPMRSDFWLVYYNKDIFDQAGVDYPSNDMTLDYYDKLARQVRASYKGKPIYGAHYHSWRSAVQLFSVLDGDNSIVASDYSFMIPCYERVLAQQEDSIVMDYAAIKTTSLHYSAAFECGNVAMMNMGSWYINNLIEKNNDLGFEWGMAKYPHPVGVEPGTTLGTITGLSIAADSLNKDQASAFHQFVCGEEGAAIIAKSGSIPSIQSDEVVMAIASSDGFPSDQQSMAALQTHKTFLEMPIHKRSAEIEVILNEGHELIMSGIMSLEEGIAWLNQEIEKVKE